MKSCLPGGRVDKSGLVIVAGLLLLGGLYLYLMQEGEGEPPPDDPTPGAMTLASRDHTWK